MPFRQRVSGAWLLLLIGLPVAFQYSQSLAATNTLSLERA